MGLRTRVSQTVWARRPAILLYVRYFCNRLYILRSICQTDYPFNCDFLAVPSDCAVDAVCSAVRAGRPIAVKVLLRGRSPSAGELLARRLRHPHLVAVYGVYGGLGTAFSAVEMEYCGQRSLQALLDAAERPLSAGCVARWGGKKGRENGVLRRGTARLAGTGNVI